jgi:hypothetical protein
MDAGPLSLAEKKRLLQSRLHLMNVCNGKISFSAREGRDFH